MATRTIYLGNIDLSHDLVYKSGTYQFTITCQSSDTNSTSHEAILLDVGKFKIGNDNDDEFELEANETSIEFFLKVGQSLFLSILADLKNYVPEINITRNGQQFFKGFVLTDNIETDIRQIIKANITDGLNKAKKINLSETPNPLGYDFSLPTNQKKNVFNFFLDAINYISDSYYTSVESNCDLKFGVSGYGTPPIDSIYFYPFWVFNQATPNGYPGYPQPAVRSTLADVIKAVADQFGCFVYTGFNRKIYLVQRVKNYITPTLITAEKMFYNPKMFVTKKFDGLHCYVLTANSASSPTWGDILCGSVKTNGESYLNAVKTLYSYSPAISPIYWGNGLTIIDADGYSGLLYYSGGNYYEADKNQVLHQYGSADSLANIVAQDTYNLISKNRLVVEGKFKGTFDEYSILTFYSLDEFTGKTFRIQKIEYSLMEDTSKIRFIEV